MSINEIDRIFANPPCPLIALVVILSLVSCTSSLPNEDNTVRQVAVSAVDLHYEVMGEGRPILLLHGFGASTYTWHDLMPYLSSTYKVIALDLKGFGSSPKPIDDRYTIEDQADLVADFLRIKQLSGVTVIAHSIGGAVALLTALKLKLLNSPQFCSLILVDTIAYDQPLPWFVKLLRTPLLGSLVLHALPEKFQVRQILKFVYHDHGKISEETTEAYTAPLKSDGAKHALLKTAEFIIPSNLDEITTLYSTIDVPTLILWGEYDKIVPSSIALNLAAALPNAKLVTINNSGHAPQEETPKVTLQVISDFLQSLHCPQ